MVILLKPKDSNADTCINAISRSLSPAVGARWPLPERMYESNYATPLGICTIHQFNYIFYNHHARHTSFSRLCPVRNDGIQQVTSTSRAMFGGLASDFSPNEYPALLRPYQSLRSARLRRRMVLRPYCGKTTRCVNIRS